MTEEYTHFLVLARKDGVVLDTYFIGTPDGYNLDKAFARSSLMDEIRMELDLDIGEEEEEE